MTVSSPYILSEASSNAKLQTTQPNRYLDMCLDFKFFQTGFTDVIPWNCNQTALTVTPLQIEN